jgi:hypothetical protein
VIERFYDRSIGTWAAGSPPLSAELGGAFGVQGPAAVAGAADDVVEVRPPSHVRALRGLHEPWARSQWPLALTMHQR